MEQQLRELNERGYMRINTAISPALVESVLGALKSVSFAPIFKDAIGEIQMDTHRSQGCFSKARPFKELQATLVTMISSYKMRWVPKNWVVLFSKAGGVEQAPHQDFPKREVTHARAGVGFKQSKEVRFDPTIQAGIILALMPDTKLIVYEGCFNDAVMRKKRELTLQPGECIIFRGDLVHAGAAFKSDNYRIHATLTVTDVPWDSNATEAVTIKQYKCAFCRATKDTSGAIHSHMQCCINNPDREKNLKRKRELNRQPKTCDRCQLRCISRHAYYKHKKKCVAQEDVLQS